MKAIILLIGLLLLLPSAHAEFFNVEKIFCDDVESQEKSITRVYINLGKGIFGLGEDIGECKNVNFYNVLITSNTTVNDQTQTTFMSVSTIGKRSSCESGVLPFDGLNIENVYVSQDVLTIENVNECDKLTLLLKK